MLVFFQNYLHVRVARIQRCLDMTACSTHKGATHRHCSVSKETRNWMLTCASRKLTGDLFNRVRV